MADRVGLSSLIASGTHLWLDSVDPQLLASALASGATGATSNPIIIAGLVNSGRFDDTLQRAFDDGQDDDTVAWTMTDHLVKQAQTLCRPVWERTGGDDGFVSFELDPLLEDAQLGPSHEKRVARYIELGRQWSKGHDNRMIKVPATPAGIDALEELAASGVTLNVTLIFSARQYEAARDAIWRGAQRRADGLGGFKSVYSIFNSRVDVYTQKHVKDLSPVAQGMVGLANAKRIWHANQQFWQEHPTPLSQQIIFASTGVKTEGDAPDKYVEALAGSDIQTNPPETNDMVEQLGKQYRSRVADLPAQAVLDEIDAKVDEAKLEKFLVEEGTRKFADPHKELIEAIGKKRKALAAS